MATGTVFIRQISARPLPSGDHDFYVVLDSGHENASLHGLFVTAAIILNYRAVQRFILARTGFLWMEPACEGRPPDAERENWRKLLGQTLEWPPLVEVPAPAAA